MALKCGEVAAVSSLGAIKFFRKELDMKVCSIVINNLVSGASAGF